jgi:protein farnesyltransferase subunit beta
LSAAQHRYVHEADAVVTGDLDAPFHWTPNGTYAGSKIWADADEVGLVHPVFVIPFSAAHESRKYFGSKSSF